MKVSILMLTHNAPDYVKQSIETVRNNTRGVPYELIVVDNYSMDETRMVLSDLKQAGMIDKLIFSPENLLFSKGNNLASTYAAEDSDAYLLLNSDINVHSDQWLQKLCQILPEGGMASFGAVCDEPVRADGYCLLIDRKLYDHYRLDEGFAWRWGVTKLQSQALKEGKQIVAVVEHEKYIHHYGGKSGNDFANAEGMNAEIGEILSWFEGCADIRLLESIDSKRSISPRDGRTLQRQRELGGYRKIVSLGYNCEVSFRIMDYTGEQLDSYPFSWAYMENQDKAVTAFQAALDGTLLTGDYYVNRAHMFCFSDCQCSFHSKATNKGALLNADGTTNYANANAELFEMRERFGHLEGKFRRLINSDEDVLFVLKVQRRPTEQMYNNIASIKRFLKENKRQRWFLLAVVEEKDWDACFEELSDELCAVDSVSQFAPDGDTQKGGAINEWMALIDYYNHGFDRLQPNRIRRMNRFYVRGDQENKKAYDDLKKWTDELFEGKKWLEQQYLYFRDLAAEQEKRIQELQKMIEAG